jgi:hypothetical protein
MTVILSRTSVVHLTNLATDLFSIVGACFLSLCLHLDCLFLLSSMVDRYQEILNKKQPFQHRSRKYTGAVVRYPGCFFSNLEFFSLALASLSREAHFVYVEGVVVDED